MLLRRRKEQQVKKPAVLTNQEKTLKEMSVEELKVYAEAHGIDLGRSSSHDGILKKIQEVTQETETIE